MDFSKLKLDKNIIKGLKASNYHEMTGVQQQAIEPALQNNDIICAAKTGSGKTLCFLLPMLQTLIDNKSSRHDGLVALIIAPTRELALQIFNVLRKVGKYCEFSAGCLIGGNHIKQEKGSVGFMNILICTPGRLLQHLDQTPQFHADNLKVLVFDECDRILDMGFKHQLDAIMDHLPNREHQSRQTMLYSATISNEVSEISKQYLDTPTTIKLYNDDIMTPKLLNQRYMEVEANDKLNVLWSYIKSHLNSKSMIFFTTCKQVKYVFEAFRQLRPGVPLMHIHGGMKQNRRMENYSQFMHTKKAVLFCTDIASRGLDFSGVDWILQVDCPEDVDQYIHRVGRSARYQKGGNALLLLIKSELKFVKRLEAHKIPIKEIKINKEKQLSIHEKLAAVLIQFKELKTLAYSYFVSYASAIYKSKDKEVFKFDKYPWEALALHIGMHAMPIIRFKKRTPKMEFNQFSEKIDAQLTDSHKEIIEEATGRKIDIEKAKENTAKMEESFLTKKIVESEEDDEPETVFISRNIDRVKNMTKRQITNAKQKEIKSRGAGKRIVFDENGNPKSLFDDEMNLENFESKIAENMAEKQADMAHADILDKAQQKLKLREQKLAKKLKKRKRDESEDEAIQAALPNDRSDISDHSDIEVEYSEGSNDLESQAQSAKKIKLDKYSIEEQEKLALSLMS
eukprot:NODE_380_length_8387_cov_0.529440.p2 type:complete len:681 gc:universal NODE_380_length_8387_cov_0.529440:4174-2132(-)